MRTVGQEAMKRPDPPRIALAAGELHQPDIAWPTVILAVVSLTLWVSVTYVGVSLDLSLWQTLPLSSVAIYMSFTPMHDSTHCAVSRKHRWLNEAVGWLCSVPFIILPHEIFRFLHLRHHKYTNDPELDPDYIPLSHPCLVPLRILPAAVEFFGHAFRFRESISSTTVWRSTFYLCTNASVFTFMFYHGFAGHLLQYWIYPAAVAVPILGYLLDYLPHHPHQVTRSESVYGCTNTVDGWFSLGSGDSTRLLTCLFLGQNFHSIHHIYPTVPWYAYEWLWHSHKDELLHAGVPVVTVFPERASVAKHA